MNDMDDLSPITLTEEQQEAMKATPERKRPFHPSYKTMLAEEKLKTRIWKISCYFWICVSGIELALLILEKI